ncbi:unnamed protein product [Linum trigynum]|uniref:gibberellin 3beta-dioxygenase n=1 Tax=Linum trigynum TaxID=586398 RepID=A0AAV2CTF3_9ROSI
MSIIVNKSSISESFKTNPIPTTQILPLDLRNLLSLPDSHTWPTSPVQPPPPSATIPVVDLGRPPHAVASAVRKASDEWGVFQVTNHGIPATLLREAEFQARRLFALPAEEKLAVVRSPDGIDGYGLARISRFFAKQMWYEGFTIMGSPVRHARQLWPNDYANFCNVMEEYQAQMKALSEKLLGLMFKSLGLAQDDIKWLHSKTNHHPPQAVLQLNSYPACPDPAHAMGLAPHTDSSLITLLHQSSNATGLQISGDGGNLWIPVNPIPGALTVNVGDLMHIATNGRFKTALHRAVVNMTRHRVSMAYFYGTPQEVKISPPMKLVDVDHPLLYQPVTWKEYLDAKGKYFNRALEFIKCEALFIADRCRQL